MATPNLLQLTSMVPTVLVSTKDGTTTDAAVYTVPSGKAVKITSGSITNISGGAVTCGVSIVPAGGTVGDGTHKVVADAFSLAAGDTLPLDVLVGAMLGDGDIIGLHPSVANSVDIVLTGVVMA